MLITKPTIPIINWGSPLSSGLIFDSGFYEGAGATVSRELVREFNGTIVASGATWDSNFYGADLDFSAAASGVDYTTPPALNSLTTPLSVEWLGIFRGAGVNANGKICLKTNATALETSYWEIRYDTSGTPFLQFVSGFATTARIHNLNWTADSKWHHFVYTCSSLTSTSATVNLYIDGVLQTATTDTNGSGAKATDDTKFYIGNRDADDRNINAKLSYLRLYNRVLSQGDVRELSQNPWQIYQQNTLPTFAPVAVTPSAITFITYRPAWRS